MVEEIYELRDIPVEFDREELREKFPVDQESERGQKLRDLIDRAEKIANPKSIYTVSYITDRKEEAVEIDGRKEFESKVLKKQLDEVERVFPYISTCGRELEEIEFDPEDSINYLFFEEIKVETLDSARSYLHQELKEKFKLRDFSSMNPGSGSKEVWPIKEQKKLFDLFDGKEKSIGVELTDNFLIVPNKSVSGIIYQSDINFETCQLCKRENCPRRKASYDRELAKEYGIEG